MNIQTLNDLYEAQGDALRDVRCIRMHPADVVSLVASFSDAVPLHRIEAMPQPPPAHPVHFNGLRVVSDASVPRGAPEFDVFVTC